MAKSKAKKIREKLIREGKLNPENARSSFVFMDMRTRTTKTKKDKLNQVKHKRQSFGNEQIHPKIASYLFLSNFIPCFEKHKNNQWKIIIRIEVN